MDTERVNKSQQIRDLLDQGKSRQQITDELGYKRRYVDQIANNYNKYRLANGSRKTPKKVKHPKKQWSPSYSEVFTSLLLYKLTKDAQELAVIRQYVKSELSKVGV